MSITREFVAATGRTHAQKLTDARTDAYNAIHPPLCIFERRSAFDKSCRIRATLKNLHVVTAACLDTAYKE